MAVCAHCKARHWECERSKSTGHYSTCCSQGKVQLPPLSGPIPSIDSCLKGRIPKRLHSARMPGLFEAKSGNKRHAGCFGDECRMNGFVSLLYFVGCFLNLCAEIM
ncbi:BQ5605_C017g08391 [Microbotryum silenes-dioicae]|uniref:BQ5605_C017g08391 protein n=1 Tax=Microbotryum silenes-dioicae TaxID=796604 RepID=A0A2X0MPD0_9BASI|nr:BQ5605_C017g08391 [Microbotryum silenes-dioicae]